MTTRNNIAFWKRILFALLASIVGIGIGTAVITFSATSYSDAPTLKDFLGIYFIVLAGSAVFGFAGWLAGLLVMVFFARVRKVSFWVWLFIGTAIGPLSVVIEVALRRIGNSVTSSDSLTFYAYAAVDAGLTSLFYLLLLRRSFNHTENSSVLR